MGIPDKTSILWVVNVFDRVWDLRVQLELMRKHYGDSLKIHVYCSNSSIRFAELADSVTCVNERDKTLGFRDAMRYTAHAGVGYDVVVSSHAKMWSTDYSDVDFMLKRFVDGRYQFAFLDDGPKGAMIDDRNDSMYCDLIVSTGAMAGCLYYPDDPTNDFPERTMYRKMRENSRATMKITHQNGGRMSNGDSGQFVFPMFDAGKSKLLCGYISETKWSLLKEASIASYDSVSSIYDEWKSGK